MIFLIDPKEAKNRHCPWLWFWIWKCPWKCPMYGQPQPLYGVPQPLYGVPAEPEK